MATRSGVILLTFSTFRASLDHSSQVLMDLRCQIWERICWLVGGRRGAKVSMQMQREGKGCSEVLICDPGLPWGVHSSQARIILTKEFDYKSLILRVCGNYLLEVLCGWGESQGLVKRHRWLEKKRWHSYKVIGRKCSSRIICMEHVECRSLEFGAFQHNWVLMFGSSKLWIENEWTLENGERRFSLFIVCRVKDSCLFFSHLILSIVGCYLLSE